MELKSLEIFGFKSFANREKLVFDQGITGIVGPNGCGKSNVVDAIRWALGEQKTKNLRSDKMESVIFNGTKLKRKSNFAEVSLTFDNTKNVLPTEYSSVKITRRLYRSGDSEYQLNGVTCRLKDITSLFMDTGISSDSYAIIELKMVDQILTNKDNERRKFFEEAAGISKYKLRKKQTLKRLKDTDDDLERVEDLLFEIEKNLKSLEKQARRTQRYFELKESYKQVSSQFAFLKMKDIRSQREQLERDDRHLQDQLTATQTEMAKRESRIQELRKLLLDEEKNLSEAQFQLNRHLGKIRSVETEKSIKNERLKYLQQRETAITNQLKQEREQEVRGNTRIEELQGSQRQLLEELQVQTTEEAGLKAELDALRQQVQAQQEETDELGREQRELEQEVQQLRQDMEIKGVQIKGLEGELQRTEADRSQREGDMDAFSEKFQQLEGEIQAIERQLAELNKRQELHQEDLERTEKEVNERKDRVYKANRILDAKQNEYNLTKDLVENLEGFPESVKFLRKNAKWIKDAPLVSDVFGVEEPYKSAFENYLEPYLSYYVVPTRKDALLSVHMLAKATKGRANFFILEELEDYQPQNPLIFTQAKPALDILDVAPEYKRLASFLLDGVYVVENEQEIPEDVPDGAIFLTRKGNLSRRKFIMSGGSLGLFEGKRLGRAKNLEKLSKELKKLNRELAEEKLLLEKATERLGQLKQVNYNKEIVPLDRKLVERQKDFSVLQTREKEHREFISRVGQRSEELLGQVDELRTSLEHIMPDMRIKQEELQQLTSRLAVKRQQSQEENEGLSLRTQAYNQAHIKLIHLENQRDNLQKDLQQREEQLTRNQANQDQLVLDSEQVRQDIEELVSSNTQDDEAIIRLYDQKKEMEERTERFEQLVANAKNSISQVEDASSGIRKRREQLAEQRDQLKERSTEIKLAMASLTERMSVEFQVDVEQLSEVQLFEEKGKPLDLESLEEKLMKLRQRVQTFGEINPMAVEAYEEMKERYDFINGQKEDLLQAKESLLGTIAEIDETAKAKFLETFTEVRENFKRVFRSLFTEDDTSDLILRDPENPLESDIGIIARPKGKRPLSISQLSGGEKTLTAVALLFAIYLIKPAPFCIFDEVDAPLDDANIDKFNNIIKEFSTQSQFIIVTHNKRTMNATNVIYGITMEERGISRAVPVALEALNLN
ncbi:MAG: chromosome segregation protein SMC [Bacteroidota bacterium]